MKKLLVLLLLAAPGLAQTTKTREPVRLCAEKYRNLRGAEGSSLRRPL